MSIKEKIKQFLDYKRITVNSFEVTSGLSRGYYRNTANISADNLVKICTAYSDLSAEWLLRGNGRMLLSSQSTGNVTSNQVAVGNISSDSAVVNNDNKYHELLGVIKKYQEQVSEFQRHISILVEKITTDSPKTPKSDTPQS